MHSNVDGVTAKSLERPDYIKENIPTSFVNGAYVNLYVVRGKQRDKCNKLYIRSGITGLSWPGHEGIKNMNN